MKKQKKITKRDILYLSISMFIIVVAWVGFNLYHTYVTSTISEDLQMKITPIDGSFDMATIDKLKSRNQIAPVFTQNTQQQASSSPTISPNPENSKESTPSGEPTIAP